jgi:pantetheine-phosphate adenylyltransferase
MKATDRILEIYTKYCINLTTHNYTFFRHLEEAWNEPHRYYHTIENHLLSLLEDIVTFDKKYHLTDTEEGKRNAKMLVLTAIFHDWYYDPRRNDNEERSAELFKELFWLSDDSDGPLFNQVYQMILDTKTHTPTVELSGMFCEMDKAILNAPFHKLIEYEKQIYKEYEFVDWMTYKAKRIEFLEKENNINLFPLIEYIKNHTPKIAIYAGSFNPFHVGHLNILHKAEKLFDKVIIAKGKNPEKNINDVEYQESLRYLKSKLPNEIIGYSGLLTDLVESIEESGQNVTIIRGIRNGFDLIAENKMVEYMKKMYSGELKVIYIPCDREFDHISSSDLRNIKKYGDELINDYLL